MKIIFLGPSVSCRYPPHRVITGPTTFVTTNTTASAAGVSAASPVRPFSSFRYAAMGAAKTLHAYMEPTHRLIRQLAVRTDHLLPVRYFVSSRERPTLLPPYSTMSVFRPIADSRALLCAVSHRMGTPRLLEELRVHELRASLGDDRLELHLVQDVPLEVDPWCYLLQRDPARRFF